MVAGTNGACSRANAGPVSDECADPEDEAIDDAIARWGRKHKIASSPKTSPALSHANFLLRRNLKSPILAELQRTAPEQHDCLLSL